MYRIIRLLIVCSVGFIQLSQGATYTVINTLAAGAGSLNAAITSANGNLGPDLIVFSIGAGAQTIALGGTALPNITETVTIDGFSQPGWVSAPIITLTFNDYSTSITLNNAPNSLIRGLILGNTANPLMNISNSGNTTIAGIY
ncbi:MAG: hypothetical protein K2Q22_11510, partial [Cytophagales bacterium]|nr:hypothetical protein [Cytophagales bacterium]